MPQLAGGGRGGAYSARQCCSLNLSSWVKNDREERQIQRKRVIIIIIIIIIVATTMFMVLSS